MDFSTVDTSKFNEVQKQLWEMHFGKPRSSKASTQEPQRSPFSGIQLAQPQQQAQAQSLKVRTAPPNALKIPLGVSNGTQIDWIPQLETNGFCVVFGASGSGKTEFLKAAAAEIDAYGIPTLIIDFHGDIETDRTETIVLSHAPAQIYGVNPLELDSIDPSEGGVYPQLLKLGESLSAFNTSIGYKQKLTIDRYIKLTYEDAGITDKDPQTWLKTPPTLADTIKLMEKDLADPDLLTTVRNDISSALGVVRSVFEHPVFSKPNRLDINLLLQDSFRINIKPLTPDVQFIVVDTILRKIASALMAKGSIPVKCEDRDRYRIAVFFDEANRFTSKATNRQGILDIYALEMRKFGLMMVLGSQRMQHFSQEILAQIAVKIALKLQFKDDARLPADEFGLSVEALTSLRGKGHGYVKFGNDPAIELQLTPLSDRRLPQKVAKPKAIAPATIDIQSETVSDDIESKLIQVLSELSQRRGWLTASTVKQFCRQFKNVSPDQIRQMFAYMAANNIGKTQKADSALEWSI